MTFAKGKKIFMDVPFLDLGKKLHVPLMKRSLVRVLTMRILWSVSANYTCWIAFYFYTSPFTKMLFHLFRFVQKHVQSKKKWKDSRMCWTWTWTWLWRLFSPRGESILASLLKNIEILMEKNLGKLAVGEAFLCRAFPSCHFASCKWT